MLKGLTKAYDGALAVDELNLEVKDKEFVVLLGPSGCGKTTTLRCVAGLEFPDEGEIYIGDRLVNDLDPKERNIAMVFQSYALYPHMTVYQNMAFPLENAKVAEREIIERVNRTARLLQVETLLNRKPAQLSGGQRQRVAVGRAIVREPQVFLMDEPLSNLDAKLRVHMRAELKRLQKDLGVTTIYVTHDQVEAMTMADRVALLSKGSSSSMMRLRPCTIGPPTSSPLVLSGAHRSTWWTATFATVTSSTPEVSASPCPSDSCPP